MDESGETNWEPYVGRAVLGGMSGTVLVIATVTIYVFIRSGAEHLVEIFLVMGVFGLAGGAFAGAAVGYVIYQVTIRTKAQPNAAVRIAIGTACLLCYGGLTSLTQLTTISPNVRGWLRVSGGWVRWSNVACKDPACTRAIFTRARITRAWSGLAMNRLLC